MKRYNVDPTEIGRLEVGTESNLDRAKSIKSYLMQLFTPHGNMSLAGVDCINACFGGTAALMNSLAWMESKEWDGRYAIVVAADVAVYEKGPARPTGGAGAVAILLGPNSPLVVERGMSATYMNHTYDFYKPDPFSPYPCVDGKVSINSYIAALEACCKSLQHKIESHTDQTVLITTLFDHIVFHSPYQKLVQKAYTQLIALDQAEDRFESQIRPSTLLSRQLGNLYCASVYTNLISLVLNTESLLNKRIGLFSYGSGLASMFFSIRVVSNLDTIKQRLLFTIASSPRFNLTPAEYDDCMSRREAVYGKAEWSPMPSHIAHHSPDAFVLDHVDASYRRFYKQIR